MIATRTTQRYRQPHQFEPLLPQRDLERLVERTRGVIEKSLRLQHAVHASTQSALRELVRAMNSYYSNRIEGQGTHPKNIERALKADFSAKPDVARRQRVAVAHIEAERELEERLVGQGGLREADVLRAAFLVDAHRAMYRRLDEADRTTDDHAVVVPGELRQADVTIQEHEPPVHDAVPRFLQRMDEVYGRLQGFDSLLYGIAAAHHRATWVHPFIDGNGRACRLQTHCALQRISGGLWSVNRGLARQRERYYQLLGNADMPRQGDLDGRGNLSEKALREWCAYFIDLCDDQVTFMGQMLDLDGLRDRIAALVSVRAASADYEDYKKEAVLPLHHVLAAGPVQRGDFCRMTGMPDRSARRVLARLLRDGLLVGDNIHAPVSFGFPLDTLNILLPNLYPEAATTNLEE